MLFARRYKGKIIYCKRRTNLKFLPPNITASCKRGLSRTKWHSGGFEI